MTASQSSYIAITSTIFSASGATTHTHEYVRFSQVLDLMPSVGVVTAIIITIIKVDGLGARHRHRPRSQLSHLRGEIRILRVHPKERMLKRVQIYRCQLHWH